MNTAIPPMTLTILMACAFVWNAVTLALFAFDKHAARRGQRRIPERRLILMTIFGGAAGAFAGQRLLRHKTRKVPFTWLIPLMLALQLALLGAAIFAILR